jgi:hypothetical protein
VKSDNLEIARFLHLKAEIRNLRSNPAQLLQVGFEILDFGFEMRNRAISNFSDFTIPRPQRETQRDASIQKSRGYRR